MLEHGQLLAIGTPAELGQHFGSAHKLDIELEHEQIPLALETLQQETDITAIAENEIVNIKGAKRERIPDLIQLLTNAHVRIYRVVLQELSLEDIYFALHGEKGEAT